MNLNLLWCHSLLDRLAAHGVRHVVASPGSRSTPLTLAALRHPRLTTHVVLDERAAAFFALGLSRADGLPAAVIATSGTAPAHWYPALIEAAYARIPLLLLSADRPQELQGCGANQTIDQRELFGAHVRAFVQLPHPSADEEALAALATTIDGALSASLAPLPGPVHLNQPLRDPLVPGDESLPAPSPLRERSFSSAPPLEEAQMERLTALLTKGPGLIVCGPDPHPEGFADAVSRLADHLGAPLLADPLSDLRFHPRSASTVVTGYDISLRSDALRRALKPHWVVRFGAFPVSAPLGAWLGELECPQILVDPHARWRDPVRRATERVAASPTSLCEALTARTAAGASAALKSRLVAATEAARELETLTPPPPEAGVISKLLAALPEGGLLFCGNSLPIRDLDAFSGSGTKRIRITANRGVSGIDGNLATALGMATATGTPFAALVGDLTLLHDLTSLACARGACGAVVVLNNGGGGIFSQLLQRELPEFESGWLTPQTVDLSAVARLYALEFRRTDPDNCGPELRRALTSPGVTLVEITLDRERSAARRRALWSAAQSLQQE